MLRTDPSANPIVMVLCGVEGRSGSQAESLGWNIGKLAASWAVAGPKLSDAYIGMKRRFQLP
jgi:hypothetical protein